MELEFIAAELKKFNVTDAALAELAEKYLPLVVNGIDDKDGLKAVNAARKIVKAYRIEVEKKRKELNANALEFTRCINSEAKRITGGLEPIELHLATQEKKIEEAIQRLQLEKDQAEAALYQSRLGKLTALKFLFDGTRFYSTYLDTFTNESMSVPTLHLKQWDDVTFNEFYENAKHYFDINEKQEAEQKAELERLKQQRRELEMEQERLADIARAQAKKEKDETDQATKLAAKFINEQPPEVINKVIDTLKEKHATVAVTMEDGKSFNIKGSNLLASALSFNVGDCGYETTNAEEIKAFKKGIDITINHIMLVLDDAQQLNSGMVDYNECIVSIKNIIRQSRAGLPA